MILGGGIRDIEGWNSGFGGWNARYLRAGICDH